MCKISDNFIPTLDFGHINALTQGSLKSEDDYREIIDYMLKTLGEEKAKKVHIHFSKIEYGAKGEIRHLTLADEIYGPEFEPLAKVLKEYDMSPVVICESNELMAHDALILKDIYNKA
jgi:deoxyribonuclease-4